MSDEALGLKLQMPIYKVSDVTIGAAVVKHLRIFFWAKDGPKVKLFGRHSNMSWLLKATQQ